MPESGIPQSIYVYGTIAFVTLIVLYVILVLFKNRVIGSRGEFLRVVDVVAVTQTSQVALVELAGSELYLMAINNDRVYPIDRVSNREVVEKIIPRKVLSEPKAVSKRVAAEPPKASTEETPK